MKSDPRSKINCDPYKDVREIDEVGGGIIGR